jgi:hypothetical protein
MEHDKMFKIVKELEFDKKKIVFKDENGVEIYLFRPSKVSQRFKDYDVKKNFQIWLKEGEREFRPNHLRVFIDLNLRVRSRPDLKKQLLLAFDNIFYGSDPDKEIKPLEREHFEHSLNSIKIIANLMQLLLIEQEYCYHKESHYNPPTLFLQGWLRQVIDSHKEIDNLCMSVANRQPPSRNYTEKENKKDKKYQKNLKSLWYL